MLPTVALLSQLADQARQPDGPDPHLERLVLHVDWLDKSRPALQWSCLVLRAWYKSLDIRAGTGGLGALRRAH